MVMALDDPGFDVRFVSRTRSQTARVLTAVADTVQPKSSVKLTNRDMFRVFVELTSHCADLRDAVTNLEISPLPGPPPLPNNIRDTLSLCPNVTQLFISLPYTPASGVLTSTFLSELRSFGTHLPHHVLLPFLEAQGPALTKLTIGPCRTHAHDGRYIACELKEVSAQLTNVRELEGPLGCVARAAGSQVTKLAAHFSGHDDFSATAHLMVFPVMIHLDQLTLQVRPSDHTVIRALAHVAPNLRFLKLVEVMGRFDGGDMPRMWDFPGRWAQDLAQLRKLRELRVVTADVIAFPRGYEPAERTVVHAWLTGSDDVNNWAHTVNHPSLRLIALCYAFTTTNNGYISHWVKYRGSWVRAATLSPPIPAGVLP